MNTSVPTFPALPVNVPALAAGEVHVWRIDLRASSRSLLAVLARILAADERARAHRFVFPHDHDRFILSRGLLRWLLGCYLDSDPAELQFTYNAYGKPELAGSFDLQFNLSHAGDLILYAFARDRVVGIDVERIRNDVEIHRLARHVFSANEQATLAALPPENQVEAFFNGWTRKEAYVKARGKGLSGRLCGFDVSLRPGEPARLLATRPDPSEAACWSLLDLSVDAGYKATLAVAGTDWTLVDVAAQPLSSVGASTQ